MRLVEAGIADVILVDVLEGLAQAKAFDVDDARPIIGHAAAIEGTQDFTKIKGADIVVVTAGLARKAGMSREDLLKKNYAIIKDISAHLRTLTPKAVVVVVSNPVDSMTYCLLKETGFERTRMFGMGAGLDSSRFNNLISKKLNIPSAKIKALVVGSHGEAMIPLPKHASVDGKPLSALLDKKDIDELVCMTKNRGAQIVSLFGSGSAYVAPSAAIFDICQAIAQGKEKEIPVSALLEGEYGVSDVCIGVPAIIGRGGIKKIIELDLGKSEKRCFIESAEAIRKNITILYPE